MSLIEYSVEIEFEGARRKGLQVGIAVSDNVRNSRAWIDQSLTYINPIPGVLEFLPIDDLPRSIRARVASLFRGRRPRGR